VLLQKNRSQEIKIKYMKYRLLLFVVGLLFGFQSLAQVDEPALVEGIRETIEVLASDEMRGREAGTPAEELARDYLVKRFQQAGVEAFFEGESYIQKFVFRDGVSYEKGASLKIGDTKYNVDEDYYPLSNSGNGDVTSNLVDVGFGLVSEDGSVNDYKSLTDLDGKIFVMELSVPGGVQNFSKHADYADIDSKIDNAIKKGAAAILLVNTDKDFTDPRKMISNRAGVKSVPVLFLSNGVKPVFEEGKELSASIKIKISTVEKVGYNVAGIVNAEKEKSIVIGAHYDHLGMGGSTSRAVGSEPAVHNGADDNASGVAAVIELAKYFSRPENIKQLNYNLIFVAFSAEEKGLLGSNAFVNHRLFKPESIEAMLNFDMIGRLSHEEPILTLIGTGTAKEWDTLIDKVDHEEFDIAKSKSGIGGSDHTSFYLKDIPVLFFFTGISAEYHTPEDDLELINLEGEAMVIMYAHQLILHINDSEGLTFQKTKNERKGRHGSKYKVTLGVMPDYTGESTDGFKIMAVTDGNPAQKAGLQGGDIIIQLGDHEIKDIYGYMEALSKFNKGDKAIIKYKREGKVFESEVIF
jgi:hypothetical protein